MCTLLNRPSKKSRAKNLGQADRLEKKVGNLESSVLENEINQKEWGRNEKCEMRVRLGEVWCSLCVEAQINVDQEGKRRKGLYQKMR